MYAFVQNITHVTYIWHGVMLWASGLLTCCPLCAQGQYLLGLRGPAQCVNFDDGPMKVHLVPRDGGKPVASPPLLAVGCFTSSHTTA